MPDIISSYFSVARITYTVLVETLNPAQSINQSSYLSAFSRTKNC